jgi:hypothetical protein
MKSYLVFLLMSSLSTMAQSSITPLLADFEAAISKHSYKRMLRTMDHEYAAEQHQDFLHGNTKQFVDEFLAAYTAPDNGGDYIPITLPEIASVQLSKVQIADQQVHIAYVCTLKNGKQVFLRLDAQWDIARQRWGFVGAYG